MKDVNYLKSNGVNLEESLALLGDMEMYDETLKDFVNMIDKKLESLEKRKVLGDMANYAIDVHALKSDAKYLGFDELAALAFECEQKSKAGDVLFIQENHPKVIEDAKKFTNIAKTYLASGAVMPNPNQGYAMNPQMGGVMPGQVMGGYPYPAGQVPQGMAYMNPGVQMPVQGNVAQMPMPGVAPQVPGQVVTPQVPGQVPVSQPQVAMQGAAPAAVPVQGQGSDVMEQAIINQPSASQSVQFFPQNPPASGSDSIQFLPLDSNDVYGPVKQVPTTTPNGKEGIILIVDDSILVVNFVRRIFESRYDVLVAADGAAAIEIVDKEEIRKNIKACLLDLNMPNVNGFEVLEHFKQKGYFVRMPVAIESGVEDAESIEKANSYPIVDILTKPFNERDVQRVIEKCLATYF